jgi:DNA-binding NtrC family response regulator
VSRARILIVEDDAAFAEMLRTVLVKDDYEVRAACDGLQALEMLQEPPDLVLTDLVMPRLGGLDLLKQIKERPDAPDVIVMTSYGTIDSAVEAMRLGASDYLAKPFSPDELKIHVERALEQRRLSREVARLREELEGRYQFGNLLGRTEGMRRVYELIASISDTDVNVLIQGETGTGKELVARAIHHNSSRRGKPFVKVDCAALTETLLESELFGHVRGSFTGATRDREGRFRMADGGTVFLDEIGNVPVAVQAKLLRVLQDSEFEPVGGDHPIQVNVRVIAATNQDLGRQIEKGAFRRDLFYRLNVVRVALPPLRDRRDDIPLLAQHFLETFRRKNGRPVEGFSPAALEMLRAYDWPGNVRELENLVERAVILCRGRMIEVGDLPVGEERQAVPAVGRLAGRTLRELAAQAERQAILEALDRCQGDKEQAAAELQISRASLYSKIKKHGIGL